MSTERTPQLVYRVTPERRRQIREWVAKNDTTIQELIDNAVDAALNQAAKPKKGKPTKKMNIVLEGQRRLVHIMPDEPLEPSDQWKNAPWGEWAELVLFSEIEGAATGLGSNIEFFLGNLAANQQIERLMRGAATDATSPDAPDYTKASDACEKAAEQLRRYFAAKWQKASETTEDSDDT